MTLKEAIELLTPREQSIFLQQEHAALRIVLAAARAFACEACGGTGRLAMTGKMIRIDCPACREDREIAMVE